MLSNEESGFLTYWEANRKRKKRVWRQLSVGLPLGVALSGAILLNLYSGWYPAGTGLVQNKERFLVIIAAVILIVIFIVIFSARHRWEMNEQHYRELLAKRDKP